MTSNEQEFQAFNGPKIVYDKTLKGESLHITPSGLLFERGVSDCKPQVIEYKGVQSLFPVEGGDLPFDPFAAAFYLITRYEEYSEIKLDKHQRFSAEESVAYKGGFLKIPVVNYYAFFVKEILLGRFPNLFFPELKTNVVPTIDIDNAFAYKYKGLMFHFGSLLKKVAFFKFAKLMEHLLTVFNVAFDPYNSYQLQFEVHERLDLKAVYFFLVGNKGDHDRNLPLTNNHFRKLIKRLASKSQVGIHPSYASNSSFEKIEEEKLNLESVLGYKISRSRQHYLKMRLPKTYVALEKIGITDDYTMGYASQIGFRASICVPYTFYFLGEERESKLTIHPFCVMDATLKYYLTLDSKNVVQTVKPLFDKVKQVGGEINILFHNESIGGKHHWKSWDGLYEDVLKEALRND